MAQELGLAVISDTIFSHEELRDFVGEIQTQAPHYIEVTCGCTSKYYGDTTGILRICDNGTIHVICNCQGAGCKQVFISPAEFAKHGSRSSNVPNWRTRVWIVDCNGKKVKVAKTCLLKYYKGDRYQRPYNEVVHRDQFLNCSICNKMRRFELRSQETCRFYHDAAKKENPTCCDMIPGRWTCEDLEERISSRSRTGCRKNMRCKGCTSCVCFGCNMCRFQDCGCRACMDFYANAPN